MKFLNGDPGSGDEKSPEPAVEPELEPGELDLEPSEEDWSITELEATPTETELESAARKSKYEGYLGTFHNVQLSLIGGFWVGVVPVSMLSSGAAVGGWNGGIVSTLLLAASAHMFLSGHPTFPIRVVFRGNRWEITNRITGRESYLYFRPSELDRVTMDKQLEESRIYREKRLANRLEAAAKRSEKRRLKKLARLEQKKKAIGASGQSS